MRRLGGAVIVLLAAVACDEGATTGTAGADLFVHGREQTADHIAVYGTASVSAMQFARAYSDITAVLDAMDPSVRQGLLDAGAKMIIARDEAEVVREIDFYHGIFPLEAVFVDVDGTDETLPGGNGVSTSRLELMYLVVYYSLLTEPRLSSIYRELKEAHDEAVGNDTFSPGEAYRDGFVDEIHLNASENNALKYGSYLFGVYRIYFGNGDDRPGEFSVTTRDQLRARNPRGLEFIEAYLGGTG